MTPENFTIWAAGADIGAVLQVCQESRFTDDPVVRALAEALEREAARWSEEREVLCAQLNEAHQVGVCRLAAEVEDFIEEVGDDVPVVDVRGAIEGLADSLCAGEYSSEDLTINSLSNDSPGRAMRLKEARRRMDDLLGARPRGIYPQEVLEILRAAHEPMNLVEVVREVAIRLGRPKTPAIYTAINTLKSKGQIEELDSGKLRIKR